MLPRISARVYIYLSSFLQAVWVILITAQERFLFVKDILSKGTLTERWTDEAGYMKGGLTRRRGGGMCLPPPVIRQDFAHLRNMKIGPEVCTLPTCHQLQQREFTETTSWLEADYIYLFSKKRF